MPATEALATLEAEDTSESSQDDPRLVGPPPAGREAYVTVDALKNFMSTMTDTIMQQVSEQVKKAVEAVRSTLPLSRFKYVPTRGLRALS